MKKFKQLFVITALLLGIAGAASTTAKNEKVLICHCTGSETNPYNLLLLSPAAAKAHELHGDKEPHSTLGGGSITE